MAVSYTVADSTVAAYLAAADVSGTTDENVQWVRTQYNQLHQARAYYLGKQDATRVQQVETMMIQLAAKLSGAWSDPATATAAVGQAVAESAKAARKAIEFTLFDILIWVGLAGAGAVALYYGYRWWKGRK